MEALEKRSPSGAPRPRGVVLLHWLTLVPLCLAFGAVLVRGEVEDRAWRAALLWLHEGSGVTVMALAAVRLLGRWRAGALPAVAVSRWFRRAASAVHAGLYLALLGVPLLGWAFATASAHLLPSLPAFPGVLEDEDLAERIGPWHEGAAYVWLAVIALHAGAALWHHFVLRDGVLRSMRLSRDAGISADRMPPA